MQHLRTELKAYFVVVVKVKLDFKKLSFFFEDPRVYNTTSKETGLQRDCWIGLVVGFTRARCL